MTLQELLNQCAATAYDEPESDLHYTLTKYSAGFASSLLKPNSLVLDVGCGPSYAGKVFKHFTHRVFAISTSQAEVDNAIKLGFRGQVLEMHDIDQLKEKFDLIWMRHVAEHSPCPMLLFSRARSVAHSDTLLYVEVPMPYTAAMHETNPNHYSILSHLGWSAVIQRSGWVIDKEGALPVLTAAGPDIYAYFICKLKPQNETIQ